MSFAPIVFGAPSAIGAGAIGPSFRSQAAGGLFATTPLPTTTTTTTTPATALARPGGLTLRQQVDMHKSGRERETARNAKAEAKITQLLAANERANAEIERLLLVEAAWMEREYLVLTEFWWCISADGSRPAEAYVQGEEGARASQGDGQGEGCEEGGGEEEDCGDSGGDTEAEE
ncbi:hypothetical protein MMC11_006759 [Xylographa trunciseda]|nr:hypothetical protein [Xylographa trunciseda]